MAYEPDHNFTSPGVTNLNDLAQAQDSFNGLHYSQLPALDGSAVAQDDPTFADSQNSNHINSTHSNYPSHGFYKMTDGFGFTTNLNAPLHENIAEAHRKHDGVRDKALKVLENNELRLKQKREARTHKLEILKLKRQQRLEEDRAKFAQERAEIEASIERLQKENEKAAALATASAASIVAGNQPIPGLVAEQQPATPATGDDYQPWTPIVVADSNPGTPKAHAPRAASPGRTSPRNHLGLGVHVPAPGAALSALPAHMQADPQGGSPMEINVASPSNFQHPNFDQLIENHENIKEFRKYCVDEGKANPLLKAAMGDIRRMCTSRLNTVSGVRLGNLDAKQKIVDILRQSLMPNFGWTHVAPFEIPEIDPNSFIIKAREVDSPVPANTINGPGLPLTFLYGINMLVKAAFKKWCEEASTNPAKADNIGLLLSQIFAMPEFTWRGESLVDMMTAKFAHDIPVLFGIRGNEKTEEGRTRLGWRRFKETNHWIDENVHNQRMTGLAAGFSSIALRDFSKSKTMVNPYKPPNWWFAMSAITVTPEEQTSNTQYIVLKYMIDTWEDKIFGFYGDKARLQLFTSICLFPAKASSKTPAVRAVMALAETLQKKAGLVTSQALTPRFAESGGLSPVWGPPPMNPMTGIIHGPVFGDMLSPLSAHWGVSAFQGAYNPVILPRDDPRNTRTQPQPATQPQAATQPPAAAKPQSAAQPQPAAKPQPAMPPRATNAPVNLVIQFN